MAETPKVPETFSDLSPDDYEDTVGKIVFELIGSDDAATWSPKDAEADKK